MKYCLVCIVEYAAFCFDQGQLPFYFHSLGTTLSGNSLLPHSSGLRLRVNHSAALCSRAPSTQIPVYDPQSHSVTYLDTIPLHTVNLN
jgi:hypothetical protein